MTNPMSAMRHLFATLEPQHFAWSTAHNGRVGVITLNRPSRKNPLTFESYAELRDLFRGLSYASDIRAIVLTGAEHNFCSGGDVFDIIEPLTRMAIPELLAFTRMTGDLVKAMRACPQPIIAAVDGVCAGAGAILAMASDMRLATPQARTAFLFTRVGLAGCDMGACALLPRIIGQGRASELLYTGRAMDATEGERWGFYNALVERDALLAEAIKRAGDLANGPAFAHSMTKTMLSQEWNVSVDQAIEMEAQAQALCMGTQDFRRAFEAFASKQSPVFEGN
ncbi:enoyl-CoA hydratase family protein [Gemmatimonas groenlandica]|uniref:Enoyl-CoA hydratase family protein n=1 Tax=Gemmatimonas groenlandica TaxID=2732249 RepID=A0A6M4ISE2_9BACT|nr:enoyl-CoA hydratase family protein [Gemmatimonas groenlandica]QJR36366.1 enoyl-CoA hydratase family protein [Gemmatimonas groenlandica]